MYSRHHEAIAKALKLLDKDTGRDLLEAVGASSEYAEKMAKQALELDEVKLTSRIESYFTYVTTPYP